MLETREETENFLNPRAAALVSNFKLRSRLIVDGFFLGHHRGPRHAFSLEYSRHRDYYPGDPLKSVDWKLYGKTDRFFVKQYEEETNLEAWLLLDISSSMNYQGKQSPVTKLKYASSLAGALSYLLLGQKDRAGLILFDDRLRKVIPPRSSGRQLNIILRELQNLQPGSASNFEDAVRHAASRIRKRGLIMLFTDFLMPPEKIEKTLKLFLRKSSELVVFHILSFEELEFPFQRFGYFEDMETKERILLQPAAFKREYLHSMGLYLETIKKTCMKLRASYQFVETRMPFDRPLATFLSARRKMN